MSETGLIGGRIGANMSFDMNSMSSLFANQPITPQQQQQQLWSLQQQFGLGLNGMLNQFPAHNMQNGLMGQPQQLVGGPPPVHAPINEAPKADTIQGIGVLTWLSAKAGLITCKDKMVISFQLKDFCDQMLNDLTAVLRVGFTLSFHAALNETSEYTATIVQPIYGPEADIVFANSNEVDLEASNPTPANSKDAYSPVIESRAIPALLAIFQRHGLQQIQLSSLHSQMSNCGDDELFRYVGTSSLKRRQFVERRTHIFRLQNDDSIILQEPAIYMAVYKLASYLLRRGGATSIQSLFDYYMGQDISQEIRDHIGEGRQEFLNLLTSHNWVFALFPNRTYVSVRRNLPRSDYPAFIKQHFPDIDISRHGMNPMAYGQPPRGIQRTMSAQMGVGPFVGGGSVNGGVSRQQSLLMQQTQQQHQSQAPARPVGLWDSQSSLAQVGNGADQWSPLFSPTTWSNPAVSNNRQNAAINPLQSIGNGGMNDLLMGGNNMHSLLSFGQNNKMVSKSVQSELASNNERSGFGGNGIGRGGCTCHCTCGRSGAAGVIGGGVNRGSSSRASGGSASPPSLDSNSPYDRFSPLNGIGSIGDRLSSNAIGSIGSLGGTILGSTSMSDASISAPSSGPTSGSSGTQQQQQQQPRYYDPFGTADLLNGTHLSSLRIGN